MRSSVARMIYESLRRGDPLDADWFWEAGMVSARDGTPLDVVIWEAIQELLAQYEPELAPRTASRHVVVANHLSD